MVICCAAGQALPAAGHGGHGGGGYHEQPAHYAYEYGVADDYSGANFGQEEKRDGYSTAGSYRVALPDGRIQHVNYHVADAYSGYVADVSYEGVPTYGHGPAAGHHAPAHHAPVVAHAAPVVASHSPVGPLRGPGPLRG